VLLVLLVPQASQVLLVMRVLPVF